MAHCVESMAFTGATPWHGLGKQLTENQPIEVWAQEAGMDWEIKETPVRFMSAGNHEKSALLTYPERKVLFRSDTQEPLSVVSQRYQVVQPREILEFYRDLTEMSGFQLHTAGVLKVGTTEVDILECKTAGEFGVRHWRDGVPDMYKSKSSIS